MSAALSVYEVLWGAAGLVFALGGAAALSRAAHRTGRTACVALLVAPILAVVLCFLGARLHAMLSAPAAAWAALVDGTFFAAAAAARQRIGGGLLLAGAFLFLAVPWASARRLGGTQVLDAVVPVAGLSIGLGRVGCFLAGCCFGVPTSVPWAVSYPAGSAAYWNHVAQGLIPDISGPSLGVHALALYLGGAAFTAAIASLVVGRRAPWVGTTTWTFILCMAGSRLILEPLRETRFLGAVPAQMQLDLVLVAAAAAGLWWTRRHAQSDAPNGAGPSRPGTPRRWIRRAVSPSPSS